MSLRTELLAMSGWRIACLHVKGWWLCGDGVRVMTLRLCVYFEATLLVTMFVDLRWSAKFSLRIEERDEVDLGVSWPLPPGPVSGHWSIQMSTFGSSFLPPTANMIKWVWLDNL